MIVPTSGIRVVPTVTMPAAPPPLPLAADGDIRGRACAEGACDTEAAVAAAPAQALGE